jgi:hypothetical protein
MKFYSEAIAHEASAGWLDHPLARQMVFIYSSLFLHLVQQAICL